MIAGFFDGASRGNPGEAGAGALLKNEEGDLLWEDCLYLGRRTNNEAEYQGLLLLLREIVKRDLRGVRISGDSKLVISQMKGEWKVRQPHLQLLWQEAQELAKGRNLRYFWIPRERNSEADALSNRALDTPAHSQRKSAPPIPEGAVEENSQGMFLPEGFLEVGASEEDLSKKTTSSATSSKEENPVLFTKVGEHIYLALGKEEYAVDLLHGSCTCRGFQFRKKCRHLEEARKQFGGNLYD
jgi:ribonuclease HI